MNKSKQKTMSPVGWGVDVISITSEQLFYQLKTISENGEGMEKEQLINLAEIAWNLAADVNKWIQAEEKKQSDLDN
jgi:hypothetical protein